MLLLDRGDSSNPQLPKIMTDILNQIYKATKSEQGYGLFKPEDLAGIADKSLIETDNGIGGPNGIAARLSAVGVKYVESMLREPDPTPIPAFFQVPEGPPYSGIQKTFQAPWANSQPEPQLPNAPVIDSTKLAQMENEQAMVCLATTPLPNIPVPPLAHRVGREKKADEYGFNKMAVGESFFVACTPDGFKKLSSVVSNRKRLLAPKSFVIRRIEDGGPWGKSRESGAGIWRVEDVVQSS